MKWAKEVKRYKLPVIKQVSHENVINSMESIVNMQHGDCVIYLKFTKTPDIKSSQHKKKITMYGDEG